MEVTPIGSISTPSSVPSLWLSLRTISGSRWPATSSASVRSLRSGRISERATIVETSATRSSSSSVTRLVSSRSVLALVLDVFASAEMLPVSSSATCRTLPMVDDMSSFTFAAARARAFAGMSGCAEEAPGSNANASDSSWAALSTGGPLTVSL